MNRDYEFELLADFVGVDIEGLKALVGSNWNVTEGTDHLLIRGDENAVDFYDEDEEDEENSESSLYVEASNVPDIGILIEYPDFIHVGTLRRIYTPGPAGYDIRKVVTIGKFADSPASELLSAIRRAEEKDRAEMRACKYCRKRFRPSDMSERGYCYGCGSERLGIVY